LRRTSRGFIFGLVIASGCSAPSLSTEPHREVAAVDLRDFDAEAIDVRESAHKRLLDRWDEIDEATLRTLDEAGIDGSRSAESRSRIRSCAERIRFRRLLDGIAPGRALVWDEGLRGSGDSSRLDTLREILARADVALDLTPLVAVCGVWRLDRQGFGEFAELIARRVDFAPVVAAHLDSDDVLVRAAAAESLGKLRANRYAAQVASLLTTASDKDADLEAQVGLAAWALGEMGAREYLPTLQDLLSKSKSAYVREQCQEALTRMRAQTPK